MSTEKKNFARRLNEALDGAGIPQKGMGRQSALVKMLDVSHRQVKKWLDGEEFPPTSKLVKMATMLGVRSNWLLSGQGERYPDLSSEELTDAEISQEAGNLSQEAFEVASHWMRLAPLQRQALKRVIEELAQTDN